jgi:transposase
MEGRERQAYWVGVINEARMYPEGISAYLREYEISKPSYYSWFRKLRARHESWSIDLPQKKKRKKLGGVVGGATEVLAKPTRRTFTLSEKVRILEAVDAAAEGQKGSVLRQEGIYHSHLQKWRKELATSTPRQRGPKAESMAQENRKLKAKLAVAEKKLAKANQIIDLQKKVSELLGVALDPIDQGED